jgi:FkbM family methyltransferase
MVLELKRHFLKGIKRFVPKKILYPLLNLISRPYLRYYQKFAPFLEIRPNTSDLHCFRQVFIQKDYKIDLGKKRINNILDLGANVGYASFYFSKRYPQAKIIAVEPEQENYNALKRNCQGLKNIIPIKGAIWYKKTRLEIFNENGGEWGFQTRKINTKNAKKIVQTYTIPELMKRFNLEKIDLLKIDIEGAEKELFSKDCKKWLDKTKIIIIELHDWMIPNSSKNFYEAIKKYNFKISKSGENLVLIKNER